MALPAILPAHRRAIAPRNDERLGSPKAGLMTPKAKAAAWDWVADQTFAAVVAGCGAFGAAYGVKRSEALSAAIIGFGKTWEPAGIATVVVGPAIFLYFKHRANRFPFEPHPAAATNAISGVAEKTGLEAAPAVRSHGR